MTFTLMAVFAAACAAAPVSTPSLPADTATAAPTATAVAAAAAAQPTVAQPATAVASTSAPPTPAATPTASPSPQPSAIPSAESETTTEVKIKITVGDEALTATLNDGNAARDFMSLLPLTLTLEDYNATEKVSDLPRRLTTEGEPAGSDPAVGDIAYYAPWGNLALFYNDFGYSTGLVILGKFDDGVEALAALSSAQVTIERVE